jgi:hypothetical protein
MKPTKLEVCTIARMLHDFWPVFAEKCGPNHELRLPGGKLGSRQQRRWWSENQNELQHVPDGIEAMLIFEEIWRRLNNGSCQPSIRWLAIRHLAPEIAELHDNGAKTESMCLAVFQIAEREKETWLRLLAQSRRAI